MIYSQKKVNRFEFVETIVPAGSTSAQQFFFPDYPQLRDAKVNFLNSYNSTILPVTSSNIPTISISDQTNGFLVLVINDKEDIKIPLSNLCAIGGSAGMVQFNLNGYVPLNGINVKWSKSYIKFGTAIAAGQFSIAFGCYYDLPGDK